jgi:hypothetical protein
MAGLIKIKGITKDSGHVYEELWGGIANKLDKLAFNIAIACNSRVGYTVKYLILPPGYYKIKTQHYAKMVDSVFLIIQCS